MKKIFLFAIAVPLMLTSCQESQTQKKDEVKQSVEAQAFIDDYTNTYVKLSTRAAEAQWKSNIEIIDGDTTNAYNARMADEALASFTGSAANIDNARKFLADSANLSYIQQKQLDGILYRAANYPQTVAELVKQRIKAENDQIQKLYGYQYMLNGKKVSTNELDEILKTSTNLTNRLAAWQSSKEVGKELKTGLSELRNLRNKTVQALGYKDYFGYQVSEYDMTTEEMMRTMDGLLGELWPLYRELHTYMRYEMAKKYGESQVPEYLPAHWVPNRWAQDWSASFEVEGLNIDSVLGKQTPQWIMQQAEALYTGLGFAPLPPVFWEKSSLYPYPADSNVKKNNHASAWHVDLQKDVRSLMSVEPNAEWFETANHELGHIYYYMSYSNPDVPPLLRQGANRAYHEAIGTMMGMGAMQLPYLKSRGLLPADTKINEVQQLLKEAMNAVVFMFFSSGTMSNFEKELYANQLPEEQWNSRWWALAKKYQGVVPPAERGEMYCDAATKTHINDDAAQYYDYALSYVLLYQMHSHIAKNILKQDPRNTNYADNKAIGDFMKKIMVQGSTKDWREVLKETTGEELNASAMLAYFSPLTGWLKEQNKGRVYTLPEKL